MLDEQSMLVIDSDGIRGSLVESPDPAQAAIRLETGQLILVDKDMLVHQSDGTYRLPFSIAELKHLRIPIVEEQVLVEKRRVPTAKVRIHKSLEEEDVVVDEPLMQEEVQVEHVPVNRYVDAPEDVRQEGETTIVPVMEEVLVVTKRLLVREELHITKRQTETHNPQTVRRRREVVHVERLPITDADDADDLDVETEAFSRDDPDKTQPRPSHAEDPTETRPGLSNRKEGS
jgi:uncharacterized protein (TIGR02271 family)